jgi:hypothetical protein
MSKYKDDPKDYWKISSDYCKVDNQLAAKIGLNEAIVLRTLYELCRSKKQTDNISWWQGKQQYWLIKFPWLSERTLFRVFERLEKLGLIEIRIDKKTGNHYRPVQKQIERTFSSAKMRRFSPVKMAEQLTISSAKLAVSSAKMAVSPAKMAEPYYR